MGYMNRTERLTLVRDILGFIEQSPKSNADIINQLNITKEIVTYLCIRLVKAGLLSREPGIKVVYARTTKAYDEKALRRAMGYSVAGEADYVECSLCEEIKPRISKYIDKKVKNTSPDGRAWSGRRCPDCASRDYEKGTIVRMTTRKCREAGCGNFLPATRYFKCLECQPELPSVDDNFIYHTAAVSVGSVMELDGEFYDTDVAFNSKKWGDENEETENDEDE